MSDFVDNGSVNAVPVDNDRRYVFAFLIFDDDGDVIAMGELPAINACRQFSPVPTVNRGDCYET